MSNSSYDTPYSWLRMGLALLAGTIGGVGMWSIVVVLPPIQADFGATRAEVSLVYTLGMLGFAAGGVLMGRLADRFGVAVPVAIGGAFMSAGYVLAGFAEGLWQFALVQGVLVAALGSSAMFGPLMADTSRWFFRRRGIAVALCASGNYFAGALWPPIMQIFIESVGWRTTYMGIGIVCAVTLLPLAFFLRRRPPEDAMAALAPAAASGVVLAKLGIRPATLQLLLVIAAISCCVAMSMPQVHIVAYCADLGFGAARGADMLAMMMAAGIVSRIASGFAADKIGGVGTLLIGSFMQMVALVLYLFFDGLFALYAVSLLFGLFQGGIVPSYALIVREYFPAAEAGTRVGIVMMATLVGMALGGWLSGLVFDLTGSYSFAFLNGIAWNLVNQAIAIWLWRRGRP